MELQEVIQSTEKLKFHFVFMFSGRLMFSEEKSNILFSLLSEELKASRLHRELKVKGVQGSRKTGGGIVFIRSESGHRLLAGDALGKTSMLCSVV